MSDIVERLRQESGGVIKILDEAAAEITRLRAIVDKLPKTADGVPVVPGMNLWQQDTDGWNDGKSYAGGYVRLTVWPSEADPVDCYSTPEAAEEALRRAASGHPI